MTPARRGWWASSQLLGLSLDIPASPRFGIRHTSAGPEATGWGLAWYPPEDRAAVVIKDPTPASPDPITRMLSDWPRFRSALFVGHLRGAARRMTQEDTQPFQRSHGGRHHVLAHNGALMGFAEGLPLRESGGEEPVGHLSRRPVREHRRIVRAHEARQGEDVLDERHAVEPAKVDHQRLRPLRLERLRHIGGAHEGPTERGHGIAQG